MLFFGVLLQDVRDQFTRACGAGRLEIAGLRSTSDRAGRTHKPACCLAYCPFRLTSEEAFLPMTGSPLVPFLF